jgi:arginine/lysine/ornithine decarboxylase
MDHDRTPVLEAIDQYRRSGDYTFSLPDPAGRISAEMISPYPPGVPAVLPGECFNRAVVDYLRGGVAAGMKLPDASDPKLETFRVVRG